LYALERDDLVGVISSHPRAVEAADQLIEAHVATHR
jgi:hypothetical protein